MFGKPLSITVTPVLAGSVPERLSYTQPDASGRRQVLVDPPIKLRYTKSDVPLSAPRFDFAAQVLGPSAEIFGLPNTQILLCNQCDESYVPSVGDKVIRKVNEADVHEDWNCLRVVHSVDGNTVILKTSKDGAEVLDEPCAVSDIVAKAVYKFDAPKKQPISVIAS